VSLLNEFHAFVLWVDVVVGVHFLCKQIEQTHSHFPSAEHSLVG